MTPPKSYQVPPKLLSRSLYVNEALPGATLTGTADPSRQTWYWKGPRFVPRKKESRVQLTLTAGSSLASIAASAVTPPTPDWFDPCPFASKKPRISKMITSETRPELLPDDLERLTVGVPDLDHFGLMSGTSKTARTLSPGWIPRKLRVVSMNEESGSTSRTIPSATWALPRVTTTRWSFWKP